jgi:hypothetical protein
LIFFLLLFSSLTLPISAFRLSILSEVWLLNFLRLLLPGTAKRCKLSLEPAVDSGSSLLKSTPSSISCAHASSRLHQDARSETISPSLSQSKSMQHRMQTKALRVPFLHSNSAEPLADLRLYLRLMQRRIFSARVFWAFPPSLSAWLLITLPLSLSNASLHPHARE